MRCGRLALGVGELMGRSRKLPPLPPVPPWKWKRSPCRFCQRGPHDPHTVRAHDGTVLQFGCPTPIAVIRATLKVYKDPPRVA